MGSLSIKSEDIESVEVVASGHSSLVKGVVQITMKSGMTHLLDSQSARTLEKERGEYPING